MSRKVTPTNVLLNQITLAASTTSVTFSSIPQNYSDLILVMNLPSVASLGGYLGIKYNGDSGNNYFEVFEWGTGSGSGSSAHRQVDGHYPLWDYTKNNALVNFQIFDYSAIDKQKGSVARAQSPEFNQVTAGAFRWTGTAAITSIAITLSPRTFESGCTFSLYGVYA